MADPDPNARAVVISVVYDGPPRAGKTTSVRALARSFGREVYTPEERDGRTVFFDWLEHVGGRFEGAPIRCQVVSVPGQRRWTRRRGHFLDRADVVVFVGDTTAKAWSETVERLAELRAQLAAREAPVGLVFQANKRDCDDAVPLAEVRARVGDARTAVVESVAADGTGIREAFVFAVRLALDRVREELDGGRNALARRGFGERSPELVDALRALGEPSWLDQATEVVAAPPAVDERGPSQDVPSGFVWPPIEGRILLREAATVTAAAVAQEASGDLVVRESGSWIVHSGVGEVFDDLDQARSALLGWARLHAGASAFLSRRRCIVLAAAPHRRWRLWQIVHRERALRDLVAAGQLAEGVAEQHLGAARSVFAAAGLGLACDLDSVGLTETAQPILVGLLPRRHAA